MARERRIPNYRKMYPAASEEVIAVLRKSERKLLYHEYDLKAEKFVVDKEKQKAFFIPSREDSLERLTEAEVQFKDENTNVEEMAIKAVMIQQLRETLKLLDTEEYELITALFYEGKSETEFAKETGILQQTLSYRKKVILKKLKKLLENKN